MFKKIRPAYLVITVVLLLGGILIGRKLSFEHRKKMIMQELNAYKKIHSVYPQMLDEIDQDLSEIFYYAAGTERQFFILSYRSGIMNANTNTYDSRTGKWTETFNY